MSTIDGKDVTVRIGGLEIGEVTRIAWDARPDTASYLLGTQRPIAQYYSAEATMVVGRDAVMGMIRHMRSCLSRRGRKIDSRSIRRVRTIRKRWRGDHLRWWCEARGIAEQVLEIRMLGG